MAKKKTTMMVTPVHPGQLLKDELTARRITQARFAEHIRITPAYLTDIVKGRRGISATMAQKIGRALATGPEIWLNMQAKFDLYNVKDEEFTDIDELAA